MGDEDKDGKDQGKDGKDREGPEWLEGLLDGHMQGQWMKGRT